MKERIEQAIVTGLLAASVGGLCSCQFLGKNLSLMNDTVSKARADDVVVEGGSGGMPVVAASPALPASTHGQRHVVVQRGETLSAIARKNGVTLSALCAANGISPASPIRSGQRLIIPSPSQGVQAGTGAARQSSMPAMTRPAKVKAMARSLGDTYIVKPGETLSGIASRHHTTVSAILRANGMKNDQAGHIRDGQKLTIPRRR